MEKRGSPPAAGPEDVRSCEGTNSSEEGMACDTAAVFKPRSGWPNIIAVTAPLLKKVTKLRAGCGPHWG